MTFETLGSTPDLPSQIEVNSGPERYGTPFLALLAKVAARIGAQVLVEPTFRIAGRITFKNANVVYFRKKFFDINPLGSLEVGRDKHVTNFFLAEYGFKVPEEVAFVSGQRRGKDDARPRLEDAIAFARSIGYPVVVKPNLFTRGILVTKVFNDEELTEAAERIFVKDDIALVQRYYPLRDYRLVVLDDRVVSGYRRIPFTVVGDGRTTIRQLIEAKQAAALRDKQEIDLDVDDFRIKANAARAGFELDSVLPRDQRVQLLDNANTSNGGSGIDMTGKIAPEFEKIAVEVTRRMNLRLCGVDLMTEDVSTYSDNHIILEINGAPGYVNAGEVKEEILEELYLEVLTTLERAGTKDTSASHPRALV